MENAFSLVSEDELKRWTKDALPEGSKGEVFAPLGRNKEIQFDYALPQQWLDNFVEKSKLPYDLVTGTTVWAYRGFVEGPVSCCMEVQICLQSYFYKMVQDPLPFYKGDEIIDDNGEIGYVTQDFSSLDRDAGGKITSYRTVIRFRWDQPSYGMQRSVTAEEISHLTHTEECYVTRHWTKFQPQVKEHMFCDCDYMKMRKFR
jgi:hypothetical protein